MSKSQLASQIRSLTPMIRKARGVKVYSLKPSQKSQKSQKSTPDAVKADAVKAADVHDEMPPYEEWTAEEKALTQACRDLLAKWKASEGSYDADDIWMLKPALMDYCASLNPHEGRNGDVLMQGMEDIADEFLPILGMELAKTTRERLERNKENEGVWSEQRARTITATETRRFRQGLGFLADYIDRWG
jgi:hypothetical protein